MLKSLQTKCTGSKSSPLQSTICFGVIESPWRGGRRRERAAYSNSVEEGGGVLRRKEACWLRLLVIVNKRLFLRIQLLGNTVHLRTEVLTVQQGVRFKIKGHHGYTDTLFYEEVVTLSVLASVTTTHHPPSLSLNTLVLYTFFLIHLLDRYTTFSSSKFINLEVKIRHNERKCKPNNLCCANKKRK